MTSPHGAFPPGWGGVLKWEAAAYYVSLSAGGLEKDCLRMLKDRPDSRHSSGLYCQFRWVSSSTSSSYWRKELRFSFSCSCRTPPPHFQPPRIPPRNGGGWLKYASRWCFFSAGWGCGDPHGFVPPWLLAGALHPRRPQCHPSSPRRHPSPPLLVQAGPNCTLHTSCTVILNALNCESCRH